MIYLHCRIKFDIGRDVIATLKFPCTAYQVVKVQLAGIHCLLTALDVSTKVLNSQAH